MDIEFEVIDFETVTVSSTSARLNPDRIKRGGVFITIETGALRYRLDGKNATAALGHICKDGDHLLIRNANTARRLSMRRAGTKNAVIMVSYLEA